MRSPFDRRSRSVPPETAAFEQEDCELTAARSNGWAGSSSWRSCSLGAPIAELAGYNPLTTYTWLRGGNVAPEWSVVLTFVAPAAMGAEWRIGIDATEPTALVSNGAFALVRNPIFTAMIIAAVGLTMIVPNVLSIVGLVSFLAAIELQVRFVEDPHLRRLHETTTRPTSRA